MAVVRPPTHPYRPIPAATDLAESGASVAGALVVSTRLEEPSGPFVRMLREAGAVLWELPTTVVEAVDGEPIGDVGSYDWVVFTSRHAVDLACQHASARDAWQAGASRPRVAAIGAATCARLSARGIEVHVVAPHASGSALAAAMLAGGATSGSRALWPCARAARPELVDGLRAAEVEVRPWVVYETRATVPPRLAEFREQLAAGHVRVVCFSAPSAVVALRDALGGTLRELRRTRVVSIGPTTSAALVGEALAPFAEASEPTSQALAAAVLRASAAPIDAETTNAE